MPKRFTDTEIWNKSWYQKLPPRLKCLWKYLYENCDNAGIWESNFELASFQIGEGVNEADMKAFGDRVERVNGSKWWLNTFVEFQYGTLHSNSLPHKSVADKLIRYGLLARVSEGYKKGIDTPKDKDKDKDKEKEKDKDKDNIEIPEKLLKMPGFIKAWNAWIEHRREIKKQMTGQAKKIAINILIKEEFPVELIYYAIDKCWQGLQWGLPEDLKKKYRADRHSLEMTIQKRSCKWCGKEKPIKDIAGHEKVCGAIPKPTEEQQKELNESLNTLTNKFKSR